MTPKRIIGLCVVAVFALSAFSASAYAAEGSLEYGECLTVPEGTGKFSGATCTKLGGKKNHEWTPLSHAVTFKSKKEKATGNAVLEGATGTEISCGEQVEKTGEYGPGKWEVKNVIGEFSKCSFSGAECNSNGKPAGFINTKKLHGEVGTVEKVLTGKEEKNVDGNDLRGEEPPDEEGDVVLAEFQCGPAPVHVRGGVVVKAAEDGKLITNKMANKIEVEFVSVPVGVQEPHKWTPGGHGISNAKHEEIEEHLEGKVSALGKFENSAQTLTTIQETTGPGTKPKIELRQCAENVC